MTDAIYIDTSCLMKLLIREPDSVDVRIVCDGANDIVVSSLAELEARSRILALRRGGTIRKAAYRRVLARLDVLLGQAPFRVEPLSGDVFDEAIAQIKRPNAKACKSLDRLHLAAMGVLGMRSILTKDARQAAVAKSLGFAVIA